jgi:hypothetical protein
MFLEGLVGKLACGMQTGETLCYVLLVVTVMVIFEEAKRAQKLGNEPWYHTAYLMLQTNIAFENES